MSYRLRQLLALAREHAFLTGCIILTLLSVNLTIFFHQHNTELEIIQNRLRREGEAANRVIAAASVLKTDAGTIETALKEIDATLVNEDNLAENLGYFYLIEDQSQARIGELRQNTVTVRENDRRYKTVPVSLTVSGTYQQVYQFLHRIETGARLIKIGSFTVNRRQPTGDAVNLTLDLEMLAFP